MKKLELTDSPVFKGMNHKDMLMEMCIEKSVKDTKDSLQSFFKNHKTWISNGIPEEDIEWYKDFLRDTKNGLESGHRDCMLEYKHHREGLNPPFCYK